MRYIGSKVATLPSIQSVITAHAPNATSLCDPFAGMCTVAKHFKKLGLRIVTGDLLSASHVFQVATISLNKMPNFDRLAHRLDAGGDDYLVAPAERVLSWLNGRAGCVGYISNFFSETGKDGRRFFTIENAKRIDAIRDQILEWREAGLLSQEEEAYLLACLLNAADRVANTAGTYMAYLKSWTRKSLKPLTLLAIPVDDNGAVNLCLRGDARQTVQTDADVLYLDPPYNSRDYSYYYHLPETIVLWDGVEPKGKSGVPIARRYPMSDFCVHRRAAPALDDLLRRSNAKFIVIHYANDGLIRHEEIGEMLGKRGDFEFSDLMVRAYSSKAQDGDAAEAHHRLYWCRT